MSKGKEFPQSREAFQARVSDILTQAIQDSLDHSVSAGGLLSGAKLKKPVSEGFQYGELNVIPIYPPAGFTPETIRDELGLQNSGLDPDIQTAIWQQATFALLAAKEGKQHSKDIINTRINQSFGTHKGEGSKRKIIEGVMSDPDLLQEINTRSITASMGMPKRINDINLAFTSFSETDGQLPATPHGELKTSNFQGVEKIDEKLRLHQEFDRQFVAAMNKRGITNQDEALHAIADEVRKQHPLAFTDEVQINQVVQIMADDVHGYIQGQINNPAQAVANNSSALLSVEVSNLTKLEQYIDAGLGTETMNQTRGNLEALTESKSADFEAAKSQGAARYGSQGQQHGQLR